MKFTKAGEVTLRLSSARRRRRFGGRARDVIDTGVGIEQAALGRLFQAFEQPMAR